ncbi:MAG: HAMP domain-containing protein [Candidatus Rokubacteria bacterium]|nr:HAMP domain-containing protein [Candidatus Rokubacteria bacterium]
MNGAGARTLARRLIIGFLVVTVPGTVLLGAVTLYSIRSLVIVNRQLEQITLSLQTTWDLHMALAQAAIPPREHLRRRGQADQANFDRLIGLAEEKLVSCASAACHAASRTPREMARLLNPAIEQLRSEGRLIFEMARPGKEPNAALHMNEMDRLVSTTNEQLHRMSAALLLRVEALRQEAHAVSRQASVLTASLTLAIVLLACSVALVLAKRISGPVQDLVVGTRRVMAGNWGYRVRVRDSGEIGELAASFNTMMEELRRYRDQLEEYSQTLEERVRERTEELKRKDEALLQSEKLASLGLLASGVAHELNNPLTSILMNVNLVIEDVGETSPLYDDLKKIDTDAGRCKRIIDDLRAFSRRRELEKAPCPVQVVVEQAVRMVEHELDLRGILVEREIETDLPEITWDSERMAQVLTNLFINAAQAMSHGGRLTVRARREDGWLRLEVRDTGVGIPAEHRSRIFDPFFTTKPDGTGLGLSISYGIVEEHGGRIEVESRTREEIGPDAETGTTVRIVLPLAEGKA